VSGECQRLLDPGLSVLGTFLWFIVRGTVDVFHKNYAPFSFGSGTFVDSTIPSGFAPFNVVNVGGGNPAVTYAMQDAAKHDEIFGLGFGYVTIFSTSGHSSLSALPKFPA
jgi:hypothetical protein